MRVYVASALGLYGAASLWAQRIERAGHTVVSSWHSTVYANAPGYEPSDPGDEDIRVDILGTNLFDLHQADVVFALTPDASAKATYSEIGYALGLGKRVIWMHGHEGHGRNIFDCHALVTRTSDPDRVLPELRRIEFAAQQTLVAEDEKGAA